MSAKPPEQNPTNSRNPSRGQNRSTSRNQSAAVDQTDSRKQSRASRRSEQRRNSKQSQDLNNPGGLKQPSGLIETNGSKPQNGAGQSIEEFIGDPKDDERRSTRQGTGLSRTANSVAGSYADDEWSDGDNNPRPLTDRQYRHFPKRKYGRAKVCDCYPAVSNMGQPSMVYEKLYCKHLQSTGERHENARIFTDNWTHPGELPPIHKTDFVVKKRPVKPAKYPKYTVLMGYPTSMYGYNDPGTIAKEAAAKKALESQGVDDESEYTDDSDAETIQEENEKSQDDDEDAENFISKNRRELYKQKAVKRTVVTSFAKQPRAVVSEYKTFLEEEGYMAGDEVYGQLEYFDMKTEGQRWDFKRGVTNET